MQLRLVAKRKEDFGAQENRRYKYLEQVVGKGRLSAFEYMTDELHYPTAREQDKKPGHALLYREGCDRFSRIKQRPEHRQHRDAEREVEKHIVGEHDCGGD